MSCYVLIADVLLTVEHVKHVLSLEVQKADSLQLSVGRYILVENKSY